MKVLDLLLSQAVSESVVQEVRTQTDCTPESAARVLVSQDDLRLTPGFQQAVYTLEAMTQVNRGAGGFRDVLLSAYLRWFSTQYDLGVPVPVEGVATDPLMKEVMTQPGSQMDGMRQARVRMDLPQNDYRHPMTLNRVLPLLALAHCSKDLVQSIALHAAKLTDGHVEVVTTIETMFDFTWPYLTQQSPGPNPLRDTVISKDPSLVGTGETIRTALLRAVWCVHHSSSYFEMLINASQMFVNQREIAGVAGVLYSVVKREGPPRQLVERLVHRRLIARMYDEYEASQPHLPLIRKEAG